MLLRRKNGGARIRGGSAAAAATLLRLHIEMRHPVTGQRDSTGARSEQAAEHAQPDHGHYDHDAIEHQSGLGAAALLA